MPSRVDVLLRKIDEAVETVRGHYQADLAAKEVSDDLLYAVRQTIQDCQSALDWTATAVKEKHIAASQWHPYFPLVRVPGDFAAELEKQLKGLAACKPQIAAAFERHQPYQNGKAELGYLHTLAKVNKHRDFTAQTREETRWIEVPGPGGSSIGFQPAGPGQAGISFGEGVRVSLGGVPVNPKTLQPLGGGPKPYHETVYVDWRFNDPEVSVLPTLATLAGLVRGAVEDINREAQL
jgi:hypothetical protein